MLGASPHKVKNSLLTTAQHTLERKEREKEGGFKEGKDIRVARAGTAGDTVGKKIRELTESKLGQNSFRGQLQKRHPTYRS